MTDIGGLALATAAFVGTHLALSHPLRLRLVQSMGEQAFTIIYSIVAVLTLGWMILAYRGIDNVPLWIAPDWAWIAGSAIMLFASILLVGSLIGNPAFPRPGRRPPMPKGATGVFAITRHPMNWAFALWAIVHIAIWGSPPNLIVAGGILFLALIGSLGQDRKKKALLGPEWVDWEVRTSFVPFGALLSGRADWRAAGPGWIALLGGLAFWLVITWLHAPAGSPIAAFLPA